MSIAYVRFYSTKYQIFTRCSVPKFCSKLQVMGLLHIIVLICNIKINQDQIFFTLRGMKQHMERPYGILSCRDKHANKDSRVSTPLSTKRFDLRICLAIEFSVPKRKKTFRYIPQSAVVMLLNVM